MKLVIVHTKKPDLLTYRYYSPIRLWAPYTTKNTKMHEDKCNLFQFIALCPS